ncbi:conserved hypothetical protein [Hymenobacter roseosalivarius DSM 11622]|uniref:Uncharacterized protein n=1 Tax=Hymenobacter roseosalivarius DSM 11622 TaxID=645990 RepID=A0A1W1W4Y5_9BACT|nr:hypothetical protein [Hymenobacter roseosalivarius]SMC00665.1 conserved hypothetical protein [Hymenobacter roseosalivarius DSM 11622]
MKVAARPPEKVLLIRNPAPGKYDIDFSATRRSHVTIRSLTLTTIMENKPNQPNPGSTPSSTGANAGGFSQKTSSAQGSTGKASGAAGSASTAGGGLNDSDSQNDNKNQSQNRGEQGSGSGVGGSVKSWVDQLGLNDTLNQLPQSVKDLSSKATTQFGKLTTTQQIVGGALLIGGLSWLALRSKSSDKDKTYKGKTYKGKSGKKDKSAYRGSVSSESAKYGSTGSYGSSSYGSGGSYGSDSDKSNSGYRPAPGSGSSNSGSSYRSGSSSGSDYGSSSINQSGSQSGYRGGMGSSSSSASDYDSSL